MRSLSSVEPLSGPRRDLDGVRVAVVEPPSRQRADGVDLVHDELDGQLPRSDLREHVLDRGHLLRQALLGGRPVGHVQDEVGAACLLERRTEALDELGAAGAG